MATLGSDITGPARQRQEGRMPYLTQSERPKGSRNPRHFPTRKEFSVFIYLSQLGVLQEE